MIAFTQFRPSLWRTLPDSESGIQYKPAFTTIAERYRYRIRYVSPVALISNCCGGAVTVEGRTTHYYVCGKCGRACDAKTPGTKG